MGKLKSKLTVDTKHWKRIERGMKSLSDREIEYGWLENKSHGGETQLGYPNTLSIPHIAALNEYGHKGNMLGTTRTKDTPPRPYFRQAIHTTDEWIGESTRKVFYSVIQGNGEWRVPLKALGEDLKDSVRHSIARQNQTPLSSFTTDLKGHDSQLVDTGVLFDNVKYKVLIKGGNKP